MRTADRNRDETLQSQQLAREALAALQEQQERILDRVSETMGFLLDLKLHRSLSSAIVLCQVRGSWGHSFGHHDLQLNAPTDLPTCTPVFVF